MDVTIIGAGNMGRGVGTRVVAGGHGLQIVDRDPAEAEALAAELGGSATGAGPDAELTGEVVVLALYYPGNKDAVRQYAERLAGKTVVDICNPVDTSTWDRLATPPGTSAAEELAQLLPQGTPLLKAFNTTFSRTLVAGEVAGQQLDVFIAGDDADVKRKVGEIVESGGLRPIDVGALERAQQLEHLGLLVITLQEPLGTGYQSAVKLHW
jgi:8-hydroxy-5-deazaflavin:NADPH oxidoreductase